MMIFKINLVLLHNMKRLLLTLGATISLIACASATSPYIFKVHDYMPAPGQFINTIPEYEAGNTQEDMNVKCTEYLAGQARGSMVCLGAYGGYIVFSFDHALANKPGEYDFKIYGNALAAAGHSDGGSSEPGIVMVSYDANHNGIPDDEWHELAGSDYNKSTTFHNYEITYYKPAEASVPDSLYIRWTSNDPADAMGFVQKNQFHSQSYWPEWVSGSILKFKGTRLGKNAYIDNGTYILRFLDWGYADNRPNDQDSGFNLDWAVDANGNSVHLDKVHFIKVYTGINQTCGWLGETSTEILGAEDLHPDYAKVESIADNESIRLMGFNSELLQIDNGTETVMTAKLYDLQGRCIRTLSLQPGYSTYNLSDLSRGVYLLFTATQTFRIAL